MGGYSNLLSALDASKVVREAVSLEEAAIKVQAFWRHHRPKLQNQPPPLKKIKKSNEDSKSFRNSPLLWKYLRSYALAERTSAVNSLLSGCGACQDDIAFWRFSLIRILLRQMEYYVVSPRDTKGADYYVAPSDRLALEWSALLSELLALCDEEVDPECRNHSSVAAQEFTAAVYYILPRISHMILELSILRNKKATGALVHLVHSLLSKRVVECESQREPNRERLQLLRDRCLWQRKSWRTTGPAYHHSIETLSIIKGTLSPLACLIAAYYISHHPKLAELVDPAGQGIVIMQQQKQPSSTKQPSKNKNNSIVCDEKETDAVVAVGLLPDQNEIFFCDQPTDDIVEDDDDVDDDDGDDDDDEDEDDDVDEDNDNDNRNKIEEEDEVHEADEETHDNPICPTSLANNLDHDKDEAKVDLNSGECLSHVVNRAEDMEIEHGEKRKRDEEDNIEKEEMEEENDNSDSEEDEVCFDLGWEGFAAKVDETNDVGDGDNSSEDQEVFDEDDDDDDDDDDDADEDKENYESDMNHHHVGVVLQEDDMDLDELQAVVAARSTSQGQQMYEQPGEGKSAASTATATNLENEEAPLERRKLFIVAALQVLELLHPPHAVQHHQNNSIRVNSLLSVRAENSLVKSINKSVKPPVKPLNFKILLRRLPSQEEFFLGSLSKNPIALNMLRNNDPTVQDLRDYIACQLQMSDSAELIELLVANKILDVSLKLRVVHAVLWKKHLIENGGNGIFGERTTYFSAGGSALSIIMSTSLDRNNTTVTSDTPSSALPPMVTTYRLIGVDGEATEDTVSQLVDPDAPESDSTSSPEEAKLSLEAEYGITRLITEGRGVHVLLRSINDCIGDTLRRIRRDDVGDSIGLQNHSRQKFKTSPPCNGLVLLQLASKLSSNRKKLLQARAPTILLTLLLEVLTVFDKSSETIKSNPTAEILQELIESLTSDIYLVSGGEGKCPDDGYASDDLAHDAASMPLLLESIETMSLSPPLRNIIAKLLPLLTYGQADLCRELARHFETNIALGSLVECEKEDAAEDCSKQYILMKTFVQSAISLPDNDVCDSLRLELSRIGFVERLSTFIMEGAPELPPPWAASLWKKEEQFTEGSCFLTNNTKKKRLEEDWRAYYQRRGIRTAFEILTGISRKHRATQARVATLENFLRLVHWLETTSDAPAEKTDTRGLGLLAETLLDEISEANKEVVDTVRRKTHLRKKELACEKRNKMLLKMGVVKPKNDLSSHRPQQSAARARSVVAPVFDLPPNAPSMNTSGSSVVVAHTQELESNEGVAKPSWLTEAEMIEDEIGLTCIVCQEGRTLQPSELLGLYAYVKKISIPMDQCGSRASIEGVNMLRSLPSSLPAKFVGTRVADEWFPIGRATAENLSASTSSSLAASTSNGQRASLFTTTVSAGNGIHITCHRKAREADRKHPKAPKSEWEGSTLRNNRVKCNMILPLVSSHSSKVSLMSVDAALTDYQSAISNLLGATPKSMLWTVLHDIRLLLLRMAYGESLSADCGGGSIASNCQLLFYQLLMADMFFQDATVDQPEQSAHARGLSSGLLAGVALVTDNDYAFSSSSALTRAIADAAPMAAITCIAFENSQTNDPTPNDCDNTCKSYPKQQWLTGRNYFLQSFLICAGRRHALGLDGSGCQTTRTCPSGRVRSSSFANWEDAEFLDAKLQNECSSQCSQPKNIKERHTHIRAMRPTIEDFQNSLRPLITLFAIMDMLSTELCILMDDTQILESSDRLAKCINECYRSRNIHDLLHKANITMDHQEILELLQRGMAAAY